MHFPRLFFGTTKEGNLSFVRLTVPCGCSVLRPRSIILSGVDTSERKVVSCVIDAYPADSADLAVCLRVDDLQLKEKRKEMIKINVKKAERGALF